MKSRSLVPLLPTVVVAITVAMVLISPAAGRAAAGSHRSYYVAPTGSDAVSCTTNTAAAPFATIQRALACTADGDVVDLAASGSHPYPGIGSVGHEVTIRAMPGADARTVSIDAGKGELSIAPDVEAALSGVTLSCPGNDCGTSPTVTDEGALTLTADELTANYNGRGAILETTPPVSSTPASLSLLDSTVSGNAGTDGGAIDAVSGAGAEGAVTLTIANSTIAGNYARAVGGAISFIAGTPGSGATITSSTITGNSAQTAGGGISAFGLVTLTNTILAANTARTSPYADCQDEGHPNGTHVLDGAAGHNLIGNVAGCPGLTGNSNGDQTDASHAGLLALANSGGPTETVALQAGSPALGAGDAEACASEPIGDRDQRGVARKSAARGCDIGAFDTAGGGGAVDRSYFVGPADSDAPSCAANSAATPFLTIQRALACTADGDVVNLAPSGAQPYPGIGALTHNVTIQAQPGASARTVAIDAGRGELAVAPGVNAALIGADVSCPGNDCATPTATDEGTLTLTRDQLTGNLSLDSAVLETTPAGSSTPASLRVIASTISENQAVSGGGIYTIPGSGATGPETLTIANSTIAGNYAQSVGGGVSFHASTPGSGATIASTTITGNTAQRGGGGLAATGPVSLTDSILAANTARVNPTLDCQDEGSPQGTHILDGASGHNLIGDENGCPGLPASGAGDLAGATESQLDPKLGPLAYNGGSTETAPLLGPSPGIGAGAARGCEALSIASKDERGRARNVATRDSCDIGAYDTGGLPVVEVAPVLHAPAAVKAREGQPVRVKLKASGTPAAALSESGALPEGVQFVANADGTASIAGTPGSGSAGSYAIVLNARNGVSPSASVAIVLTVRP
jgi:hypothetical protein